MPDLYSHQRVHHVNRFDGRTRIIRVRRGEAWTAVHGLRLNRKTLRQLKEENVREVELRRWLRHARMPVSWLRLNSR